MRQRPRSTADGQGDQGCAGQDPAAPEADANGQEAGEEGPGGIPKLEGCIVGLQLMSKKEPLYRCCYDS